MKRFIAQWGGWIISVASAILLGYGLAGMDAKAQVFGNYDSPAITTGDPIMTIVLERLVIIDPATDKPRIILRTIDGMPAIIFLYSDFETEDKAVLDFRLGRTTEPKSIVGGGPR